MSNGKSRARTDAESREKWKCASHLTTARSSHPRKVTNWSSPPRCFYSFTIVDFPRLGS